MPTGDFGGMTSRAIKMLLWPFSDIINFVMTCFHALRKLYQAGLSLSNLSKTNKMTLFHENPTISEIESDKSTVLSFRFHREIYMIH